MLTRLKKEFERHDVDITTIPLTMDSWYVSEPLKQELHELINPTFGVVNLLFFQKTTTRSFYLMDFSSNSLRSVQMWRIWQAHNLIEQFWKILKSVLAIGLMRLRGDGLYTGLLIKIMAYLFVTSLQYCPGFRHLSLTQIMRQLRRESDLLTLLSEHFHLDFLGIAAIS